METKFQFRDAFRHKMTAKIPEHVIGELLDSEAIYQTALHTFLCFPEDESSDRPPNSSYNFAMSD